MTDGPSAGAHSGRPHVGPLAEEAARLAEAVAAWSRGSLGDLPLAGTSEECTVCPVCQMLRVVRGARPETFAHLVDASAAMLAAFRSVVETHGGHSTTRPPTVERIDLDDTEASA